MIAERFYQKAYRSQLDRDLSELLAPLAKNNVSLYFPFFANTFPIACHYYDYLKAAAKDPEQYIKLARWGDDRLGKQAGDGNTTWYCTVQEKPEGLSSVPIGVYQPQWMFAAFNLQTSEVWNSLGGGKREVSFAEMKDFEIWEIFTEIPKQAEALLNAFEIAPDKRVLVAPESEGTWCDERHLEKETLRLFLYGAPLTTYFLRKTQHYIPLRINGDKISSQTPVNTAFDTVMAAKFDGDGAGRESVVDCLTKYHAKLFEAARQERDGADAGGQFRSVQYHYNRVARALQHRSSFLSSQDFAKCLADHHDYPPTAPQSAVAL
jgi:hypothetical protein